MSLQKKNNHAELQNLYNDSGELNIEKPNILENGGITIQFPTNFSKKKMQGKKISSYDITIHSNDEKPETIFIAEKLAKINDDEGDNIINDLLVDLINNSLKNKLTSIVFKSINESLIKKFSIPISNYEINDNEINNLINALHMIGINDNCAYINYKNSYIGYINHISIAICALNLYSKKKNKKIIKLLNSKNIYDTNTFRRYLYNNNVIKYSEIKDLLNY